MADVFAMEDARAFRKEQEAAENEAKAENSKPTGFPGSFYMPPGVYTNIKCPHPDHARAHDAAEAAVGDIPGGKSLKFDKPKRIKLSSEPQPDKNGNVFPRDVQEKAIREFMGKLKKPATRDILDHTDDGTFPMGTKESDKVALHEYMHRLYGHAIVPKSFLGEFLDFTVEELDRIRQMFVTDASRARVFLDESHRITAEEYDRIRETCNAYLNDPESTLVSLKPKDPKPGEPAWLAEGEATDGDG